jgi:hypothetical protein
MARGGARPGAGRPKTRMVIAFDAGDRVRLSRLRDATPGGQIATIDENGELVLPAGWISPLEHLLAVVNDKTAAPDRRDRAAFAAAPFCHVRISGQYISGKLTEEREAKRAGDGTPWQNVLRTVD